MAGTRLRRKLRPRLDHHEVRKVQANHDRKHLDKRSTPLKATGSNVTMGRFPAHRQAQTTNLVEIPQVV